MRKLFKKTLITVLSLILVFSLVTAAIAATVLFENDFTIRVEDDGYTRLNNWSGEGVMKVPSSIMNHYVNEIEDYSFTNNQSVTGLNIENVLTMRRIGKYAFAGSGLSGDLTIPNYITSIDISAFQETPISSFVLYSGVKDIPEQICYSCTQLIEVSLNYGVKSIGRLAFAKCGMLNKVTINWTVTEIDDTAFYNSPNVVIYCYTDSYAHQYAEDKGIEYVLIDGPMPTEPATEATTATEPVTEATEATEPPTTPVEVTFVLGDADNSGNVDIVDATFAQRFVTRSEIPAEILSGMDLRADIDSSGEVESTDVTFIMRHIIRLNVPYPVGELITV